MKYIYLYIFLFLFQGIEAQVITSATNPTPGTVNKQIGVIGFDTNEVKKVGNAQVWNFPNLTLTGINVTTSYSDAASSPYSSAFPGANIIQNTTNQPDAFFKADNSGMHFIGGLMASSMFPNGYLAAKFTPAIAQYNLPMQYGNHSSESTSFFYPIPKEFIPDSLLSNIPFQLDSIRLRIEIVRNYDCIGAGTINLPLGSFDVVQVDFSFKPNQKLEVKVPILGWIDVSQFVNLGQFNQFIPEVDGIYFLSPNHSGPIAAFNRNSITGRIDNGLISSLAINATNEEIKNITFSISPNPASDYIELKDFKAKYTDIRIIDAFGHLAKHIEAKGDNKMNISSLAPGVYFLNLYNEGKLVGFSKFIKI